MSFSVDDTPSPPTSDTDSLNSFLSPKILYPFCCSFSFLLARFLIFMSLLLPALLKNDFISEDFHLWLLRSRKAVQTQVDNDHHYRGTLMAASGTLSFPYSWLNREFLLY